MLVVELYTHINFSCRFRGTTWCAFKRRAVTLPSLDVGVLAVCWPINSRFYWVLTLILWAEKCSPTRRHTHSIRFNFVFFFTIRNDKTHLSTRSRRISANWTNRNSLDVFGIFFFFLRVHSRCHSETRKCETRERTEGRPWSAFKWPIHLLHASVRTARASRLFIVMKQ